MPIVNILCILFIIAASIGMVALVYNQILLYEAIGQKWLVLLRRITGNRAWLMKPLAICGKCFAGQVALWLFLFSYFRITPIIYTSGYVMKFPVASLMFHVEHYTFCGTFYNPLYHIFFISAAILSADLFIYFYKKVKQ